MPPRTKALAYSFSLLYNNLDALRQLIFYLSSCVPLICILQSLLKTHLRFKSKFFFRPTYIKRPAGLTIGLHGIPTDFSLDRKSVVEGKSEDVGGRRIIKTKRRKTTCSRDWSSDVCSSDLNSFFARLTSSDLRG